MSLRRSLPLFVALLAAAPQARAQLELGSALRNLERSGSHDLPTAIWRGPRARVGVLAEYPSAGASELLVAGRYRPLWLLPEELRRMASEQPEILLHWAPPRHVLLDEAGRWIGLKTFRNQTGLTGKGVVVGIVDTGLDVGHPDLMTADGKSRVRFLLDLSRPPAERQPELEAEYGCSEDEAQCAIYSGEDLDAVLHNGVTGDEPRDAFGHGTHVASLAAGNGLSSPKPRYIGVAPEATIFAARVSRAGDGAIQDADLILATRFVFEQAERLHLPAVVNLSLGSDFGKHDGSSPLEQGLASFIGPEYPGRAIVVAAGNSGSLYSGIGSGEPEPYGIHTEVHVPRESPVEIPIMTPTPALGAKTGASIYVWLGFRAGDEVSVGLDHDGEDWIPLVAPGAATTYSHLDYQGTIFNGPSSAKASIKVEAHNAVVVIDGNFEPGAVFTLRLSGHGSANLWLQSTGGASPEISTGALFPRGEKQGTINIPASHPDLIAVGATVNRNRWRDYKNHPFLVGQSDGGSDLAEVDGTAVFSAAGPNALGVMKPDIVAPGMYVAGAMSRAADPRKNGGTGVFASQGRCGEPDYECFVLDDEEHAITSGTSMSAPLVAGAIALLFERRPELTSPQARALLQAGARKPSGPILAEQQLGPGALDLNGMMAALAADESPIDRVPTRHSQIALAAPYVRPDPQQRLQGLLELRDDGDLIADGFDERRLRLEVHNGKLAQAPLRVGPGLYRFEAAAPEGSGGQTLTLSLKFDDRLLSQRSVPIGTDLWSAEGDAVPHGGCHLATPVGGRASWSACGGLLLALALRRRFRAWS